MESIKIDGTENSPEVSFDFEANIFALRGMSYIEDVTGFYGSLMGPLYAHLGALSEATVRFDIALSYFNSSSARVIFRLFEKLDEVAEAGNKVTIQWYHEDDEDQIEVGEEFGEDLEHAELVMVGKES